MENKLSLLFYYLFDCICNFFRKIKQSEVFDIELQNTRTVSPTKHFIEGYDATRYENPCQSMDAYGYPYQDLKDNSGYYKEEGDNDEGLYPTLSIDNELENKEGPSKSTDNEKEGKENDNTIVSPQQQPLQPLQQITSSLVGNHTNLTKDDNVVSNVESLSTTEKSTTIGNQEAKNSESNITVIEEVDMHSNKEVIVAPLSNEDDDNNTDKLETCKHGDNEMKKEEKEENSKAGAHTSPVDLDNRASSTDSDKDESDAQAGDDSLINHGTDSSNSSGSSVTSTTTTKDSSDSGISLNKSIQHTLNGVGPCVKQFDINNETITVFKVETVAPTIVNQPESKLSSESKPIVPSTDTLVSSKNNNNNNNNKETSLTKKPTATIIGPLIHSQNSSSNISGIEDTSKSNQLKENDIDEKEIESLIVSVLDKHEEIEIQQHKEKQKEGKEKEKDSSTDTKSDVPPPPTPQQQQQITSSLVNDNNTNLTDPSYIHIGNNVTNAGNLLQQHYSQQEQEQLEQQAEIEDLEQQPLLQPQLQDQIQLLVVLESLETQHQVEHLEFQLLLHQEHQQLQQQTLLLNDLLVFGTYLGNTGQHLVGHRGPTVSLLEEIIRIIYTRFANTETKLKLGSVLIDIIGMDEQQYHSDPEKYDNFFKLVQVIFQKEMWTSIKFIYFVVLSPLLLKQATCFGTDIRSNVSFTRFNNLNFKSSSNLISREFIDFFKDLSNDMHIYQNQIKELGHYDLMVQIMAQYTIIKNRIDGLKLMMELDNTHQITDTLDVSNLTRIENVG